MKYRIVEREYPHSGTIKYVVERAFDDGMTWTSVYTSTELEKAQEVYRERLDNSTYKEKVLVG